MKISIDKKDYTQIFTAALFVVTKYQKQPECLSPVTWFKILIYSYIGMLFSIKKKHSINTNNNMDEPKKHYYQHNKPDTK